MVVDNTGQETIASRNCNEKYLQAEIELLEATGIKSSPKLFKVSAASNTIRLVRD